jgi:hypothetical protein
MSFNHKDLRRWWNLFNRKYHGGKLPQVTIRYEHVDGHCACLEYFNEKDEEKRVIRIDTLYALDSRVTKVAIHHEQIHLATGSMVHGKIYYDEEARLYRLGAFKGLL